MQRKEESKSDVCSNVTTILQQFECGPQGLEIVSKIANEVVDRCIAAVKGELVLAYRMRNLARKKKGKCARERERQRVKADTHANGAEGD